MSEWGTTLAGPSDWDNGVDSVSHDETRGGFDADANAGGSFGGPGGGGGGRACFNCGEEGHQKSECTKPRVMKCKHCNKEGHLIRDCPEPDVPQQDFTGECRICHKEGHMAKDCPDKGPLVCKNCQQEGHVAFGCPNARSIDRSSFREVDYETAWEKIMQGIEKKDMDEVKEGIQEYVKSQPATSYADLEESFRGQGVKFYLIALENSEMMSGRTLMDLQGNLGKKYRVQYRWNDKPLRGREKDLFPKSAAENVERLRDAGEIVYNDIPKCHNCGELGHTSKRCPQEKVEKEQTVVIKCFNCDQTGHRIRDCPEPRKPKFGACKNCGQDGHMAKDCEAPRRAPDDLECRKCGGTGHFAKDCPEGGNRSRACFNCGEEGHNSRDCTNPKKIQCRNCDEYGHVSKECPKPRDYSRVKCSQCGQMGHTQVRCKAEVAPVDDEVFNTPAADTAHDGASDSWQPAAEVAWEENGGWNGETNAASEW
ncbi:hypothetical protein ABKA04_003851 [Annulohypoxylon sp. FPYF3050]